MRASSSRGIPEPVSETATSTPSRRHREPNRRRVISAPACVRAFATRLSSTCRRRTGSASKTIEPSTSSRHHVRAAHGERCDDIACERRDVDGLRRTESIAMSTTIRSIAREAATASRTSSRRWVSSTDVSVTASATADNAATGLRTSCTSSASRACSKSGVTLPAQPTVAAPSARCRGGSRRRRSRTERCWARAPQLPTLPAATSALRLSQRGSLRGT